ncbi:MAG: glycosyltransferase [Candidatus Micrarchaeia archaeon]
MKKPAVSVLMPFYDDGKIETRKYCVKAIESILAQTFRDFEIILVVSGKKEFAEKLASSSKKIRLFVFQQKAIPKNRPASERIRGVVTARNLCLRHARGKYVAFADADDISLPDRLEKQLEFLNENPGIGLVGTTLDLVDENGNGIGYLGAFERDGEIRRNMLHFPCLFQPTVLTYRKLVEKAGGYRQGELSEDYDLWVRMAGIAKLHNMQAPLVKYRMHGGGGPSRYKMEHFVSSLRVKHRAMKTLGLKPTLNDVAVNLLQFCSIFYPRELGLGLFLKLREFAFAAVCPQLNRKTRKT